MNTFYCILYFNIRPEINEKLSIGMIMAHGHNVQFNYSKNKLSAIRALVSESIYKAASDYLKYISRSVQANESIYDEVNLLRFNSDNRYSRVFSESYLEYLSRYNNNLLSFAKPKLLDIEYSESTFNRLYSKLVDQITLTGTETKHNEIMHFKKKYYPKFKSYFSINKSLDSRIYKRLLAPIKIDLLGKNDHEVFGQLIDFNNQTKSLEHNVSKLLHLHYAIPDATKFILGTEPKNENEINHRIWNNVRLNKEFKYIDFSEAGEIEEYAKVHGVTPLFANDTD